MSSRYFSFLAALSSLLCCTPSVAQYGTQPAVRRERNLDHWDSNTLAYFLDEYPGYDAAVMFYAQWDSNSHSLAPYFDRIGTLLEAGTTDSRLVMALFDCEDSNANSQLCEAVGITHYPTLMFFGSGPYHDTDPITKTLFGAKRSAGHMGNAPVPNTVKFQGNWQYADAVLDWIRTMQALSNWHTWTTKGFGRRLRNFLLPYKKPKSTPLPIGIPANAASSSSSSSSADTEILESMIEILSNRTTDLEKVALRSTIMMESVLLPSSTEDMFTSLSQSGSWTTESATPTQQILRNCVLEVSLDYCQRVGSKAATDMVDELEKQGVSVEDIVEMDDLQEKMMALIEKAEPYCVVLDDCVVNGMQDEKCRPDKCPFQNPQACSYLTACLEPDIQQEYAEAMGLNLEEEATPTEESESGEKKGWGF
jgi:hypothetical protein